MGAVSNKNIIYIFIKVLIKNNLLFFSKFFNRPKHIFFTKSYFLYTTDAMSVQSDGMVAT